MRPRQFWVYMTIYISILLMLFLINYSGYKTGEIHKTLTDLFKSLYFQFVVLQIIVLWIWASFNSGSAIRDEVSDKTYDFFRMFPISASKKAVGILAGKNLIALLVAGCNFVIMSALGIAGGLNPALLLQMILIIVSVAILANSGALLISINPKGKKNKGGIIGFILIAFFLGPMIINGVFELAGTENIEKAPGRFFEFELPVLILTSAVVLYFSWWCIKGILRKFTFEDEPVFTRKGAMVFLLGYELVLLGLFYHYLKNIPPTFSAKEFYLLFLLASMGPVLLIPPSSIRSMDRYLEYAGFLINKTQGAFKLPRFLLYSNLSLWLGLSVIWACFVSFSSYLVKLPFVDNLLVIAASLSFYIFIILLLETNVLISPYAPKIGVLLAFILGVYVILPLILSGIFDIEFLVALSPFGYYMYIFNEREHDFALDVLVIIVNLLLCIAPAVIILNRYTNVIRARQRM